MKFQRGAKAPEQSHLNLETLHIQRSYLIDPIANIQNRSNHR